MSEKTFSEDQVDEILEGQRPTDVLKINGQNYPIRPLNLKSFKQVFKSFTGVISDLAGSLNAVAASKAGMGDLALGFTNAITGRFDDMILLVHAVLVRGTPGLTIETLEEHMEVAQLQDFFDIFRRQNRIDAFLGKAKEFLNPLVARFVPGLSNAASKPAAGAADSPSFSSPTSSAGITDGRTTLSAVEPPNDTEATS